MGSLNQRLTQLEKGLRGQPVDPGSDAYFWAALNDPASLDLLDQHLAALADGDVVSAAEINAQIDQRLEAIAKGGV